MMYVVVPSAASQGRVASRSASFACKLRSASKSASRSGSAAHLSSRRRASRHWTVSLTGSGVRQAASRVARGSVLGTGVARLRRLPEHVPYGLTVAGHLLVPGTVHAFGQRHDRLVVGPQR